MPLLCIKCKSRVDRKLSEPKTFMCPEHRDINLNDTISVSKRFFAQGDKEVRLEAERKKRKKIKGLKRLQQQKIRRNKK
uniref:Uncharacterized protein n=1 Tax=viral metagenome TaxID=1070528 RepID=A0A6H2A5G8_9ZZZZ